MLIKYSRQQMLAVILGALAFSCSAADFADPPMRVARLGHASGAVSFSPAGAVDWTQAALNRPLIAGDRLWADVGARDEVQIGSAAVRMDGNTLVTLLALDDRALQMQLSQGRLNVRVRQLDPDQVFEIDTPNLALSIRQPGDYRIDVDSAGAATSVMVRAGQAHAYGQGTVYSIDAGQAYRFSGAGLRDASYLALPAADEFDGWTSGRDRRADESIAGRYVSYDITGYQDLDDYGTWRDVEGYGNVWLPSRAGAGRAPYRDGNWAFVHSRAVAGALVRLPAEAIARAPVTPGANLAPLPVSVRGNALAGREPAAAQLPRPAPANTAPPAPARAEPGANGGWPLDLAVPASHPGARRDRWDRWDGLAPAHGGADTKAVSPVPLARLPMRRPAPVAGPAAPVLSAPPAPAALPVPITPVSVERPGPRTAPGISPLPPQATPGAARPERHDGEARPAPRPAASPDANVNRERAGREVQRRHEEQVKRDEDAKNRK